jgi:hypothetical protein
MTQIEIKQLAEKIYEEYIFGGKGRPAYGVDFDKRHIIEALEMMVHKTREWQAKNKKGEVAVCRYCETKLISQMSIEGGYCDVYCLERQTDPDMK